jgi:hypothetical protein
MHDVAHIGLQGNNFSYTCGAQQSYINDICLPSSAPTPSQLPPLGTSTSSSRTSTVGLPQTNMTLPTSNSSLPDQLTYPGECCSVQNVTLSGHAAMQMCFPCSILTWGAQQRPFLLTCVCVHPQEAHTQAAPFHCPTTPALQMLCLLETLWPFRGVMCFFFPCC